eukprot:524215_1
MARFTKGHTFSKKYQQAIKQKRKDRKESGRKGGSEKAKNMKQKKMLNIESWKTSTNVKPPKTRSKSNTSTTSPDRACIFANEKCIQQLTETINIFATEREPCRCGTRTVKLGELYSNNAMVFTYHLCCSNVECRLNRGKAKLSEKIETPNGKRSENLVRCEFVARQLGHSGNFISALTQSGFRTTTNSTFYRYQHEIDDNNIEVVENTQRILITIAVEDGGSLQISIDCAWPKAGHCSVMGIVNLIDLDREKWYDGRPKVLDQECMMKQHGYVGSSPGMDAFGSKAVLLRAIEWGIIIDTAVSRHEQNTIVNKDKDGGVQKVIKELNTDLASTQQMLTGLDAGHGIGATKKNLKYTNKSCGYLFWQLIKIDFSFMTQPRYNSQVLKCINWIAIEIKMEKMKSTNERNVDELYDRNVLVKNHYFPRFKNTHSKNCIQHPSLKEKCMYITNKKHTEKFLGNNPYPVSTAINDKAQEYIIDKYFNKDILKEYLRAKNTCHSENTNKVQMDRINKKQPAKTKKHFEATAKDGSHQKNFPYIGHLQQQHHFGVPIYSIQEQSTSKRVKHMENNRRLSKTPHYVQMRHSLRERQNMDRQSKEYATGKDFEKVCTCNNNNCKCF